jgi:transposase
MLADSLDPSDRVVLEATGNALAIARILAPGCAEVLLAHPKRLRAISHAKVKTDKFDARVLAELLAANLVPAVWIPDEQTRRLRRQISRRCALVKRCTAVKNEISAVLIRNLKRRPEMTDVFGRSGREWLNRIELPLDERETIDACLRQLDFVSHELLMVDTQIAEAAIHSEQMRRLMTIPGVDATTAATVIAAIGDVRRFPTSRHLVGYLGFTPRSASRAAPRHVMDARARKARPPRVTSLSRQPGSRHAALARCARSGNASLLAAASTSPRWPLSVNVR